MGRIGVIGSGLGSLLCAYALSKKGGEVIVLEAASTIGGAMQTFPRKGSDGRVHHFDTGFHYVGAMGEGDSLRRLFDYFSLSSLPWKRLDGTCVEEIFLDGCIFRIPAGHAEANDYLSSLFPSEREGLSKYFSTLKDIGDGIFSVFSGEENPLLGVGAKDFIHSLIKDPLLRRILGGAPLRLETGPSLPLYTYAQIYDSFLRGGWRLPGGGKTIVDRLSESLESMGCVLRTASRVVSLLTEGTRVKEIVLGTGERLSVDYVVSGMHPSLTASLVEGLRHSYVDRLRGLENTIGTFSANVILRPGSISYINHSIHVLGEGFDPWKERGGCGKCLMIHSYPEGDSLDLLSPMPYYEVSGWKDDRGPQYDLFKENTFRNLLSLAEEAIPNLSKSIDRYYLSTPLTWERYTGTPEGSSFGVKKDYRSPLTTFISPRTPLQNLFLTGQSLNLHGLLGVGMSSVLTCCHIPGMEELWKEVVRR